MWNCQCHAKLPKNSQKNEVNRFLLPTYADSQHVISYRHFSYDKPCLSFVFSHRLAFISHLRGHSNWLDIKNNNGTNSIQMNEKVNEGMLRSLYFTYKMNEKLELGVWILKLLCPLCLKGPVKAVELWDAGGNSSKGTWGLNVLSQKELAWCVIMIRQWVHQGQSCTYQTNLKGVKEPEKIISFPFCLFTF